MMRTEAFKLKRSLIESFGNLVYLVLQIFGYTIIYGTGIKKMFKYE